MSVDHVNPEIVQNAPILGLTLFLSIFAGKAAMRIGVPKVTAFILVGLILGPTAVNILTPEVMERFEFINELAFGLILFNIGGRFNKELFVKMQMRHIKVAFGQCFFSFFLSFISLFILLSFTSIDLKSKFIISLLLGIISIEAAPPTTLLVMKEYSAKGPLSDAILFFLAISTLLAIVFSDIAVVMFETTNLWNQVSGGVTDQILGLIWQIGAPLPFGLLLGIILSYWEQKEKKQGEIYLAVVSIILCALGLSSYFNFNPLLTSLFLGFTVVNTSSVGEDIHKSIGEIGLSIYALFFVFAGAHIHIQEQLKTIGAVGVFYIISRGIGIIGGSWSTAKIFSEPLTLGKYRGLSLLGHAGAALAIASKFKGRSEESALTVFSVIMSSIFIFEVIGPFLLKFSLKKTEEIQPASSGGPSTSKNKMNFRELFVNFLCNLKILTPKNVVTISSIKSLIKRDVVAITSQANFNELTKFFEQYQSSIFPVVDENHRYEGLISMKAFKNAMLDSETRNFTRAINLIGQKVFIHEDASFQEAIALFNQYNLDSLPVVNTQNRDLIGILSYKDVVMAMQQSQSSKKIILGDS